MTELDQFKKWVEQTKRYMKLIKEVDKIKAALQSAKETEKGS